MVPTTAAAFICNLIPAPVSFSRRVRGGSPRADPLAAKVGSVSRNLALRSPEKRPGCRVRETGTNRSSVRPSVRHSVSLGWIGPAHLFRQRSQACTLQRERRCLHLSDGASPRSDDQCTTWSSKKTFFARGLKASLLLRPPPRFPSHSPRFPKMCWPVAIWHGKPTLAEE